MCICIQNCKNTSSFSSVYDIHFSWIACHHPYNHCQHAKSEITMKKKMCLKNCYQLCITANWDVSSYYLFPLLCFIACRIHQQRKRHVRHAIINISITYSKHTVYGPVTWVGAMCWALRSYCAASRLFFSDSAAETGRGRIKSIAGAFVGHTHVFCVLCATANILTCMHDIHDRPYEQKRLFLFYSPRVRHVIDMRHLQLSLLA